MVASSETVYKVDKKSVQSNGKDTLKFFFQGISWNNNLTLISQCIFTLNSNQTVFLHFHETFQ